MKHLHRLLPLALAAALAGLAVSDGHRADAGDPISGAQVTLTDVVAHPLDYLGGKVHFTLQLESRPESWNPFLTRFGTDDYRAVIAWGDEQALWERSAYQSPVASLFVRRGTPNEESITRAGRYARFEATGIVRQVLVGRPWIELIDLVPLAPQFTEGSLIHASRAMDLMAAEHWDLAAQSFQRAMASDLPDRMRLELDRLRAACLAHAPAPIDLPEKKKRFSTPPAGESSGR